MYYPNTICPSAHRDNGFMATGVFWSNLYMAQDDRSYILDDIYYNITCITYLHVCMYICMYIY